MKMLIVESPTKRKNIAAYLGAGWVVEASFGHVRDLPKGEMGIDFGNYQPAYVLSDSGKKVMTKRQGMSKQMEEIWLATAADFSAYCPATGVSHRPAQSHYRPS